MVGDPELFVSEVDESDGSIALYRPSVAVLTNVSLDHHSMDELRSLFGAFLARAGRAVVNLDDPESRAMADTVRDAAGYGFDSPQAAFIGRDLQLGPNDCAFMVEAGGDSARVALQVPGRHNASNALAAIAAAVSLGVALPDAAAALGRFEGLKRRLEIVGTSGDITIVDDFAHNPDKIAASLATLAAHPGRLLVMFQPHGFGPLAKMGDELAATFTEGLRDGDRLYLPDPVYQGGTVDQSRGSAWLAERIAQTTYLPERSAIGDAIVSEAGPGDRIVIMGARDDTLSEFAAELLARL